MNFAGRWRPIRNWLKLALGLAAYVLAGSAAAEDSRPWLRAEPLSELPVTERQRLHEAIAQPNAGQQSTAVNSTATCAAMLQGESDVRPSVVASVCEYVGFELAAISDSWIDAPKQLARVRNQLLEMSVARNVGRWREFVAIRSGWLARLAGHPIDVAKSPPHPALRPWLVIRALDDNDVVRARAQQIFLGAPKCPRACAYAALVSLSRGMLAAHDDQQDQARILARRAAKQLVKAADNEPRLVALLAPEVAMLLDKMGLLDERHEVMTLGRDVVQRLLPQGHAAHRHFSATQYGFLAADGKIESAAALRDELTERHGRHLARYPLTAARLRVTQSGRSQ